MVAPQSRIAPYSQREAMDLGSKANGREGLREGAKGIPSVRLDDDGDCPCQSPRSLEGADV